MSKQRAGSCPGVPAIAAVCLIGFAAAGFARADEPLPYWAFAVNPGKAAVAKVAERPLHVPGSRVTFLPSQVADLFGVPDWHPEAHGAMPPIVAHGRRPDAMACGYCHLPNGQGRPENARLAGLSVGYITRQMEDFRSGRRRSSDPRLLPVALMAGSEVKASDAEVADAARYFAELKPRRWIRVVESATVPTTRVAGWMLVASAGAGTEPIGDRIIEMPENLERTELRDDTSGFVAYVPPGSVKRGAALAKSGGEGASQPCATCHGPGLQGLGDVPSIAGRSPSYLVRQLYDMKGGARAGAALELMKPVADRLRAADILALAAYLAALDP